ncbi:DUF5676 family membrane protein [Erythrobacter mangrovi]|uniref:Uncharacterized protein n=1 Tax=Erythrobacter mangrovi TaxID=2739433 RepID=A0A7D3XT74_9SPHN|nr:DUF5676 family membrane protein [Erythrobacter mangrovi]QKG69896.1 hypothetical protein HQR01_00090 [Erythrobacter mangrovi]
MKIDAIKLGLASGIVFAIVWVICSLFVFAMPMGMSRFGGHMVHADLAHFPWILSWAGFLFGLIAWSVLAGIIAWGIAAVYNRLLG